MTRVSLPRLTIGFVFALVFTLVAAQAASALEGGGSKKPIDPGKGGKGKEVVVRGVIIDISVDGQLLVIDRGEIDDDAEDDVPVSLTDETKIVPEDAALAVGDRVKAVAKKPDEKDDPLVAISITVGDANEKQPPEKGGEKKPKPPEKGKLRKPIRACGVISELPDPNDSGELFGEWVVEIPGLAVYRFGVDETTKIVPPRAEPKVGVEVCFQVSKVNDEWVASRIELKVKPKPSGKKGTTKKIIHGTMVGDPPADTSVEWNLEVALKEGTSVSIVVRPTTEVEGELADGARLVVHAVAEVDASGAQILVAEKIKVAEPDEEDPKKARGAVKFAGIVSTVEGDEWTITSPDGNETIVVVDDETKILGLDEGADPVGRSVEGHAKRDDDGTLVARLIKFKDD